jgi:hypothetical protein
MALYYFLGIKESFEVIPPPNTEVQKLETSTGVSEVVSGEKSQEILQEIRGESNNTIFRAYKDRIMMIKDWVETELFSFVHILNIKADELMKYEYGIHELIFLTDKNVLLFKYHLWTEWASINGIDIDTKKYIWWDRGIDGRELYWSPDKKNLAIVWQYFESIKIFLTKDDDIRNIKEIVSTQRSENANFYWESNNTFIYKPNTTPDEEGFRKAIIESGFDPVINRFSVRDTNSTSFSPSQISEILTKLMRIPKNKRKSERILQEYLKRIILWTILQIKEFQDER